MHGALIHLFGSHHKLRDAGEQKQRREQNLNDPQRDICFFQSEPPLNVIRNADSDLTSAADNVFLVGRFERALL